MTSISSQDVAGIQRPRVRHGEDALQSFDLGNGLLDVHDWPVYLRTLAGENQTVTATKLSFGTRLPAINLLWDLASN